MPPPRVATVVFLAAIVPLPLFAAHPLVTDDTGTQGKGNVQIELTTEHGYEQEDGTRENTVNTNVVFSYGLRDNADVILTLPHKRVGTEAEDGSRTVNQGQADVGLDVKWRFYEKDKLSLALKPGPTPSRPISPGSRASAFVSENRPALVGRCRVPQNAPA